LSRERIRMELIKLLLARHAVPALAVMTEAGLLEQVLGGVPLLASFANMVKLEAALSARFQAEWGPVSRPESAPTLSESRSDAKPVPTFAERAFAPDPVRRLGALAVSVVEDAERLRERLRLANAEHERLAAMADGWWQISWRDGERGGRVLLYRLGPVHFIDRVLLAWTRSPEGAADQPWHKLATLPRRWSPPVFPLKAADFIRRGVPKGPRLGAALAAAEEAWIAADFPSGPAALAAIAERAAAAN
jgi:poly(A) polymerase